MCFYAVLSILGIILYYLFFDLYFPSLFSGNFKGLF